MGYIGFCRYDRPRSLYAPFLFSGGAVPSELCDYIIDRLHGRQTLKMRSVVSKPRTPRCRRYIFSSQLQRRSPHRDLAERGPLQLSPRTTFGQAISVYGNRGWRDGPRASSATLDWVQVVARVDVSRSTRPPTLCVHDGCPQTRGIHQPTLLNAGEKLESFPYRN